LLDKGRCQGRRFHVLCADRRRKELDGDEAQGEVPFAPAEPHLPPFLLHQFDHPNVGSLEFRRQGFLLDGVKKYEATD
jgi:hypothetical protein